MQRFRFYKFLFLEVEFEVVVNENPYLPEIPENLDEDIHGAIIKEEIVKPKEEKKETFQAGYKEIAKPVKPTIDDRQKVQPKKPQPGQKQNFFPLGKPQRPPFRPNKPASVDKSDEGSFLSILPFWKSGQAKPKRPIGPPPPPVRPLGHKVTKLDHKPDYPKGLQAPLLVKVDDPEEEVPVRPETDEKAVINSRIDNSIHTELVNEEEAFVVLPSDVKPAVTKKVAPRPKVPQRPRHPPPPPKRYPRPPRPLKPRLPSDGPLPMLSQPVIGLPQVPAGRKQAPFIPKRPLLPPQVPQTFPGGPKAPLKKPPPPPAKELKVKPEEPKKPFLKKPPSLSPKVIAKLTSQTNAQDKKPFDFR